MANQGLWIDHCDDPPCGLGRFEYACPACGREQEDFEVWFLFNDVVLHGKEEAVSCPDCKAALVVYYNKDVSQTEVRVA